MADFPNFGIPDVSYSGLTDTADGFTGSTTLVDTTLGSPLVLDTSQGTSDISVTDFADFNDPAITQQLSGVTDPPIGSAHLSVTNINPPQPSSSITTALTGLGKLGSAFSTLLGGARTTQRPVTIAPRPTTATSAASPIAASGTTTIILVIVLGAIILLLAREGD